MALRTETRTISEFSRIDLRFVGELYVSQGHQPALTIEAEEEVLQQLVTEVQGDTLVLELGGDWLTRLWRGVLAVGRPAIKYHVTATDLRGLKVSGYGKVTIPALRTEHLELTLSGYGKVAISGLEATGLSVTISGRGELSAAGSVHEQRVFISGSGDYHAKGLSSSTASITISGHGKVKLAVSEQLEVKISGYGTVDYLGNPALSQAISGGGRVRQVKE
jgi:hypothetical protein